MLRSFPSEEERQKICSKRETAKPDCMALYSATSYERVYSLLGFLPLKERRKESFNLDVRIVNFSYTLSFDVVLRMQMQTRMLYEC